MTLKGVWVSKLLYQGGAAANSKVPLTTVIIILFLNHGQIFTKITLFLRHVITHLLLSLLLNLVRFIITIINKIALILENVP